MIDEDEAKVIFTHGDTLVMIAHLANAVTSLNSAMTLISEGKQAQASGYIAKSGEQVDQILKVMRDKMGSEVVTS